MAEATLMPGFESHVADIAGVRTHYYLGGDGPSLVVVHGLGGAAVNFTELAPELARSRRVLVPDLPGHCGSDPLDKVEGLTSYAEHVLAVAEHERMLPADVVGYSMGGVVSLRAALARRDAVRALVLVASAGIVSVTRRAEVWWAILSLLRPAQRAAPLHDAIVRRSLLRWVAFGPWGAVDPPALSRRATRGLLEGAPLHKDLEAAGKALLRDDPREDLERICCPTLLLWGARDRLVPLEDGFEFARRLRAPIRTLPAAGHLLISEQPVECADVIGEFLDGVGEVDELPFDAELLGQLRGERADA